MVGLSLPTVLDQLGGRCRRRWCGRHWRSSRRDLLRFLWVFPATYVPRLLSRRLRERDPYPPWQYPAMISWTGMRGAVSLAAALAVPLHTDAGSGAFPGGI